VFLLFLRKSADWPALPFSISRSSQQSSTSAGGQAMGQWLISQLINPTRKSNSLYHEGFFGHKKAQEYLGSGKSDRPFSL
jgi:hypothetical protein